MRILLTNNRLSGATLTIGEVVNSIEFSDAEKDRIGKSLLDAVDLPYEILTSKVPNIRDLNFWSMAQEYFKVHGFRPGHPSAKQMVQKRAMETLRTHPGAENDKIWPLYRACVRLFVNEELGNLEKLLSEEPFSKSEGALTDQILRAIISKIPLYDVKVEEVSKLYEAWGFERSQLASSILSASANSLDISVIKRMIAQEIERAAREQNSNFSSQVSALASDLKRLESKLSEFDGQAEEFNGKVDRSVAILRSEFQNLAASVLNKKVHEISATIKKASEKGAAKGVKSNAVDADVVVQMQSHLDKMSKRLKLQEQRLATIVPPAPSGAEVSGVKSAGVVPKTIDILPAWGKVSKDKGLPFSSAAAMFALTKLLSRSRIVLMQRPEIVVDFFARINGTVERVGASPNWTSPEAWSSLYRFISEETSSPKLAVILDFDVAVQETYLIPAISQWLSKSSSGSLNRLLLVPSQSNYSAIAPRVLEQSLVLDFDCKSVCELDKTTAFLDPKLASALGSQTVQQSLAYSESINLEFERNLKQFAQNAGVVIPPRLLSHFINLYLGAHEYLSPKDSGRLALDLALLPWVKAARGENATRVVEETLKIAFTGS